MAKVALNDVYGDWTVVGVDDRERIKQGGQDGFVTETWTEQWVGLKCRRGHVVEGWIGDIKQAGAKGKRCEECDGVGNAEKAAQKPVGAISAPGAAKRSPGRPRRTDEPRALIGVYVGVSVKEQAEELAREEGRSLSAWVSRLIDTAIQKAWE